MVDAGLGSLDEAGFTLPYIPSLRGSSPGDPSPGETYDRFIPNRSAMDLDMARCLLYESRKEKENINEMSTSRAVYQMLLKNTLMKNSDRILTFKNKPTPPKPKGICEKGVFPDMFLKSVKQLRNIPQIADRTLDAPGLVDNYYFSLLDWGSSNVLSVALGNTLYLWCASDGTTTELMTASDNIGPLTSVSWAPDGRHVAIGLSSSDIQLWDVEYKHMVRNLRGVHRSSVGSLDWYNKNILTTGGMDGLIVNNDVNIESHKVQTYRGHRGEVCCLKWSDGGDQLASRGKDNLLHIWELNRRQWVHRFKDHNPSVKALAWCPSQRNLLASGGAGGENRINFWNTRSGACLNSVDTGSQVRSLVWSKNERELVSLHGLPQNQLILWKYPSMNKLAYLSDHLRRFIFMAQSPDGKSLATAGNELLEVWNVFPETRPPLKRENAGPLTNFAYIR